MELKRVWSASAAAAGCEMQCQAHLPSSAAGGSEWLLVGRTDGVIESFLGSPPEHDVLLAHTGSVTCLDILPQKVGDAQIIMAVSGSTDSSVRLWRLGDASDGGGGGGSPLRGRGAKRSFKAGHADERCVQVLTGHGGTVTAVKFLLDSLDVAIASTSADGTLRLWHACSDAARRHMTRDQWYACSAVFHLGSSPNPAAFGPRGGRAAPMPPLSPTGASEGSRALGRDLGGPAWATALAVQGGETPTIYAGCSTGSITVVQPAAVATDIGRFTNRGASPSPSPRPQCTFDQSPLPLSPTASEYSMASTRNRRRSSGGGAPTTVFAVSRQQERTHSRAVTALLLLNDHNLLISTSYDGTAHICDALDGTSFLTLHNPRRSHYSAVTWLRASQELVLGDTAGWLYCWDVFSERQKKQERLNGGAVADQVQGDAIYSLTSMVTDDGVSAGVGALQRASGESKESVSVCSAQSEFLQVTSSSGVVRLRVVRKLAFAECGEQGEGHTDAVVALLPLPADNVAGRSVPHAIAAAHSPGSSRPSSPGAGCAGGDEATEINGAGRVRFFSVGMDNIIRCWDRYAGSGRELYQLKVPGQAMAGHCDTEFSCALRLAASRLSGALVTGHADGVLRLWDSAASRDDGTSPALLRGQHSDTVSALCETSVRGEPILLSADYDGKMFMWHLSPSIGQPLPVEATLETQVGAHVAEPEPEILCMTVYEEPGADAVQALDDGAHAHGATRGFSPHTTSAEAKVKAQREQGVSLRQHQPRSFAITGGNGGVLRVFSLTRHRPPKLVTALSGHDRDVAVTALIVHGDFLVAGAEDGFLRVWDMRDVLGLGQTVTCGRRSQVPAMQVLSGAHRGAVQSLASAPSIGAVLSCGSDGAVRVWTFRDRLLRHSGLKDSDDKQDSEAEDESQQILTSPADKPLPPRLAMVQEAKRGETEFKCIAYQYDANFCSHDIICATESGQTLFFPLDVVALSARHEPEIIEA